MTVNNNTYDFDVREVKDTKRLNLTELEVGQIASSDDAVREILAKRGVTFQPEDALKISTVQFKFRLRTIHYSPTAGDQKPECYKIAVAIKFDNSRHTGQVHVTLATVVSYVNVCNGRIIKGGSFFAFYHRVPGGISGVGWSFDTLLIGGTDILVLILCILSLILCCRALIKAHLLQVKTSDYFENVLKQKITVTDQLDFLNMWYVMIVVNDTLIILGTVAKISIEFRVRFKFFFEILIRQFLGFRQLVVHIDLNLSGNGCSDGLRGSLALFRILQSVQCEFRFQDRDKKWLNVYLCPVLDGTAELVTIVALCACTVV